VGEYLLLFHRLNLVKGRLKSAVASSDEFEIYSAGTFTLVLTPPPIDRIILQRKKLEESDDPDAAVGKFDLNPPRSYSPKSRPEDSEGPTNGHFQPNVAGFMV